MKILFIGVSYVPEFNGMSSVTRYLAEGLAQRGHDVSIATQRHNNSCTLNEVINGVYVYRFDIYRSILKSPSGDVGRFRNFVLHFNSDVYIFECIGSLTSDIMFPFLDKIDGIKILHSHGNTFKTMNIFKLRNNLKYTLGNTYNYFRLMYHNYTLFPDGVKKFDACVYLSPISSDRKIIESNSHNTYILHNAADKIFFDYNPSKSERYKLNTKYKHYLLSVANFTKIKNEKLLVKSYFQSKVEGYSLVLIGSSKTEYYYETEELIKNLSAQNPSKDVVLVTGIDRKFIPQIVDEASLYLTGSEYEEYSVSLIEAMSRGIPFISTDVGNARILPGGITLKNKDEMPDVIDKLLQDKKLYSALSHEGCQFAKDNCQEDVAVENLLTIIKSIKK